MPESLPLRGILDADAYRRWQGDASAAASWISGRVARPGRRRAAIEPAAPQHTRFQPAAG